MKVIKYIDLPIDEDVVEIGLNQARTRYVDRNLDELARSIDKVGLLEPIVVAPLNGGRYEIITGQRRYLACERLGWETISAGVLESKPEDKLAKGLSLVENLVREDMTTRDYIAACTYLFREYGSVKIVSEELGISPQKVSQYVKHAQLIEPLKARVDDNGLELDAALRAQRAATDEDGDIDEAAAIAFADEMAQLSNEQRRKLEKIAQDKVGAPVEEIIEEGRRQPKIRRVSIRLSEELHDALDTYANDNDQSRDDAIVGLLETGLTTDGYIS